MAIPACGGHRLVVTLDHGAGAEPTAINHGPVPQKGACDAARKLVRDQLGLANPAWEP